MATLRIRLKSRKMAPCNQVRLHVRRHRDESVAKEYKRELVESLGEPNYCVDPEKLWTEFKTKIPKVSKGCLRDTPVTSNSFLTTETLNIIEESRRALSEDGTVPGAEA